MITLKSDGSITSTGLVTSSGVVTTSAGVDATGQAIKSATLTTSGLATVGGGATISGGPTSITGTTTVTGTITLQNSATPVAQVVVGPTATTITGPTNIVGATQVTGATILNGDLTVQPTTSTTTINGKLTGSFNGGISVNNKLTVSELSGSLWTANDLAAGGASAVSANFAVTGATGAVKMNGPLSGTFGGVLGSGITVGSNLFTVDSSTGAVTTAGTLNVTGAGTIGNGLTINGAVLKANVGATVAGAQLQVQAGMTVSGTVPVDIQVATTFSTNNLVQAGLFQLRADATLKVVPAPAGAFPGSGPTTGLIVQSVSLLTGAANLPSTTGQSIGLPSAVSAGDVYTILIDRSLQYAFSIYANGASDTINAGSQSITVNKGVVQVVCRVLAIAPNRDWQCTQTTANAAATTVNVVSLVGSSSASPVQLVAGTTAVTRDSSALNNYARLPTSSVGVTVTLLIDGSSGAGDITLEAADPINGRGIDSQLYRRIRNEDDRLHWTAERWWVVVRGSSDRCFFDGWWCCFDSDYIGCDLSRHLRRSNLLPARRFPLKSAVGSRSSLARWRSRLHGR